MRASWHGSSITAGARNVIDGAPGVPGAVDQIKGPNRPQEAR